MNENAIISLLGIILLFVGATLSIIFICLRSYMANAGKYAPGATRLPKIAVLLTSCGSMVLGVVLAIAGSGILVYRVFYIQ